MEQQKLKRTIVKKAAASRSTTIIPTRPFSLFDYTESGKNPTKKVSITSSNQLMLPTSSSTPICQLPIQMLAMVDPNSNLFMNIAQSSYAQHMDELVPCKTCGRKFFPDRIDRHQSSCSADPVRLNCQSQRKDYSNADGSDRCLKSILASMKKVQKTASGDNKSKIASGSSPGQQHGGDKTGKLRYPLRK